MLHVNFNADLLHELTLHKPITKIILHRCIIDQELMILESDIGTLPM